MGTLLEAKRGGSFYSVQETQAKIKRHQETQCPVQVGTSKAPGVSVVWSHSAIPQNCDTAGTPRDQARGDGLWKMITAEQRATECRLRLQSPCPLSKELRTFTVGKRVPGWFSVYLACARDSGKKALVHV